MKFSVNRGVVLLFFFFLATIISTVASAGVSVELKGLQIEQTQKGFLVKGTVVGSGLNTPIPEKDMVDIVAEIKKGPNAKYPKLPQYYNIAAGCPQIAGKCLTKEEKEGINITSVGIASIALRPGPVWRIYGGLGEWEKRAPARVEKPFQGYIPLQYAGKEARIHVTLTHVIGGPYAAWPGISYYHAVKEVVLPGGGVSGNAGSRNHLPKPNKKTSRTAVYKISATKKGYLKGYNEREINIDTTKRLIVWGTVYDTKNKVLPFTVVTLTILGEKFTTKSDANGYFKFDLLINPNGNKTVKYNEDLHLKKPVSHITAQILSKKLAANGRIQIVKVRLISEKGIIKNKKFYISKDNLPLLHNGRKINYAKSSYESKYITTDSNGIATFTVTSPKVDVNLVNRSDDKRLFPIVSRYNIYSLENGEKEKVGTLKITFLSPRPHITKVLLPGGVEEQLWQSKPSRVFIDDIDSNHFRILIRGWGRFRSKSSGVRYNTLIRQFDGKEFDFFFSPKKLGFDLNNQPQLWKELMITNLKVLGSVFVPLAQNGALPYIKYTASDEFKKLIDALTVKYGIKDYANLIKQAHNSPSYINTLDGAVGGALLGDALNNIISNKYISLGQTLQLEALKAVYANLATIYNAYVRYGKIARAYQDIDLLPIIVIVTDNDGYKDRYLRYISVKVWKEGE
ncbi:carboxypeptidase-like regulatory domain-containing protein [Thermosulfurimonas dismutans]|uniref:Uncharacterized protein n=1 Tax=Thermosulfurimonas dismutans TaxID=999894 RepID=A0A179D4M8_9BACT|nr:carboxypeptidase-like regulatory domain-containing protein [Thermosulfurimonas dismutans]OAQ20923.1 hypothetical protein TDIS_1050 [Thermosulfurimonas dismutans]